MPRPRGCQITMIRHHGLKADRSHQQAASTWLLLTLSKQILESFPK